MDNNTTFMSLSKHENMLSVSTMSNSTHTNINQVPSDLIPTASKSITFDYASNTKNWACMFDRQQFQSLFNNEHDPELVKKWQYHMINMQSELRRLGLEHAYK